MRNLRSSLNSRITRRRSTLIAARSGHPWMLLSRKLKVTPHAGGGPPSPAARGGRLSLGGTDIPTPEAECPLLPARSDVHPLTLLLCKHVRHPAPEVKYTSSEKRRAPADPSRPCSYGALRIHTQRPATRDLSPTCIGAKISLSNTCSMRSPVSRKSADTTRLSRSSRGSRADSGLVAISPVALLSSSHHHELV